MAEAALRELSEQELAVIGGRLERLRLANVSEEAWMRVCTILAEMMIHVMTHKPVLLLGRDEAYLVELFEEHGVL